MKKRLGILMGLVLSTSVLAMTVEQEQRFLYYFYEAERLWQAEAYADAFAMFEFCHELHPDDAITNQHLGHVYRGCKLVNQALPFYKKAWEKAPETCWKDYAITLYNTGEKDNKTQAIKVMEQTSKQYTQDDDLWANLRDAYLDTRNFKGALMAQDQVDKINGYDAYSAIHRYRIYVLMQKPKLAIGAIEQYLQEEPTNLQFLLYRMQLYEMIRAPYKTLIPIYQDIIRLDPYNALALNNYAYLLATHRGDLKLAENMSAKSVQADPQNPVYLDTYAWIMHLTGQDELAKLYIRQAVDLFSEEELPKEVIQHYNIICKE